MERIFSRQGFDLTIAALVGAASLFGIFFIKLYRARSFVVNLQRRGLPVAPGHSLLFGHLLYLKSFIDRYPPNAYHQYGFCDIAREQFHDTGVFYIDLWPISAVYLVIASPKTASEVTQENPHLTSERPHILRSFLRPLTGGLTLFDLPEQEWKPWRVAFNKGFHSDHIMSFVPDVITETQTYAETLRSLAHDGQICYLDTITLRFTIDMIGRTILNTPLRAQKGYNALADGMLNQIQWLSRSADLSAFSHLTLLRPFVQWKNGRQMDRYIGAELDRRYSEYLADPHSTSTKSKSVIDIVLRAYMSTLLDKSSSPPAQMDPTFRAFAIRQIRLFVFAGHDSTSSVICYCFYLLSQHPEILTRLREEHDQVLGKDLSATAPLLTSSPRLVNNLPFTLAVIKETLRLFPPAGGTRAGKPGVSITDDTGTSCPTDGCVPWVIHVEVHRNPKYWVQPDVFLPDRWLVPPGHELRPQSGAWRPFEHGPRNCIAQGLVLVELRVILACVVREFDIVPAYEELDGADLSGGVRTWRGERAYLTGEGAAHPAGRLPCRIKLAERARQ